MKKLMALLVLCLGFSMTGCAGLGETQPEANRRIKLQAQLESKMLNDDVQYMLLLERSSRLTQWHPYVGR